MLDQVQKMQGEMERVKNELAKKTITEESGGGMVSVTMTGAMQIIKLNISKELVNPDDIEVLEDLVVAAVNKAIKSANDLSQQEMNSVTGMLPNIPGLNFNL